MFNWKEEEDEGVFRELSVMIERSYQDGLGHDMI